MDRIQMALLVVLGMILGAIVTLTVVWVKTPNCPTEDSCIPDYYNGQWHIVEVHK